MTDKRFEVVMNEFDEIEYITDIVDCEDIDFADFLDYANKMAKENEQLRHDATILIQSNQDYRRENEQLKTFREQNIQEYNKLKKQCNECKLENEQLKNARKELELEKELLKHKLENGKCPMCGARVSKCGGLK